MIVVEELRWCIRRRSTECVQVVQRPGDLCAKSEVAQLHMLFTYHQNVLSFDIAMNVAELMLFEVEKLADERWKLKNISPYVELREPTA